MLRYHKWR